MTAKKAPAKKAPAKAAPPGAAPASPNRALKMWTDAESAIDRAPTVHDRRERLREAGYALAIYEWVYKFDEVDLDKIEAKLRNSSKGITLE